MKIERPNIGKGLLKSFLSGYFLYKKISKMYQDVKRFKRYSLTIFCGFSADLICKGTKEN